MTSTSLTATTAASAGSFVSSLGINTHIDFNAYGYQNLATVESNISYLGVKLIRDSAQTSTDAQTWLQVAQATGAKFDDYVGETSPAGMQTDLGYIQQLAQEGILAAVEGGDEEDDAYPESLGNSPQITAQFQQQLYTLGQQLGLPVINMSFGAGWTSANNWEGDYGTVGDLSAYTDYANAHTYPNVGQLPDAAIQDVNGLAKMAASTRPVITTEIGWQTTQFDEQTIAKYVLDAAMDGLKDGDAGMYFYGLYDDGSGAWGLFNADGTPRPAATALHNLTTLLVDTGSNASGFTPGSLTYGLSGTQSGDSSALIEKSDGSFWLSLWNETEAANTPHTVTVNLATQAATVVEYDPLTGTSSIETWSNVSSIQVSVPDHPILLEIIPAATSSTGSSTTTPTTAPTTTTTAPTTTTTTPTGPVITVPASENVTAGTTTAIGGVSVTDAFAASTPGTMALNLDAGSGTLTVTDSSGSVVSGSGTHAISTSGTFTQISYDLAHLSYTAGATAGADSISINIWDQAGLESTMSVAVSVTTPPPTSSSTIIIASGTADPVITASYATISAIAGNHMIFIGGTHDVLTATGGTETVQAYQGNNTITTGSGNDTIRIAGTGNVVSARGGNNQIDDSGSGNRIVMPGAGQGMDDIYGYVLLNGDTLGFRSMLAGTKWNHSSATLGNYLKVSTPDGSDAVISVTPTGVAGSTSYTVATLHGSGPVSLSTLLAHSVV